MGHEITASDHIMLAMQGAWHGLGTIVSEAKTPREALKIARLDWEVEQDEIFRGRDKSKIATHVENYRSDNGQPLGVVGVGYVPTQNVQLADFATALANEGDVTRVETAGSIRGGRRVWFLIRGASFSVGVPKDEIGTYLMVANGHDGTLSTCCYFTSIRVVCRNTFDISMGMRARRIAFRHEGDIDQKIEDARRALGLYAKVETDYEKACKAMAAAKLQREEINDLIMDALTITEGEIITKEDAAKDKKKAKKRDKQVVAYRQITARLDKESADLKQLPNAWTVFNAYTGWLQHDRKTRGSGMGNDKAKENAVYADQFGMIATAKATVFQKALALVK